MSGISFQNLLLLNASIPKYEKEDKKEEESKTFDFTDLVAQKIGKD